MILKNIYQSAVEMRQEEDQLISTVQTQLNELGQLLTQTADINDIQVFDQTFEVKNSFLSNQIFFYYFNFKKFNLHLQTIQAQFEVLNANPYHKNVSHLHQQFDDLSQQIEKTNKQNRPILVEKQTHNELLDSSANWLIDLMKQLSTISTEPISIQYDQVSNRLKDLLNEIQLKSQRINDFQFEFQTDSTSDDNRSQLISHFKDTQTNIQRLINDREDLQSTVQTLDQTVLVIQQSIKILRNNLEQYRLGYNTLDELHVRIELKSFRKSSKICSLF